MKTFKALSALLSYPGEDLIAALPQIEQVLQSEGLLGPRRMDEIRSLLQKLGQGDLYDLQERYVLLFDRSRSLSLNLFEHVHGESRDRGGAMVDLLETYRDGGFDLAGSELPDHLPVLLEYLSTRPLPEALALLADASHILVALAERLTRRESAYAAVLGALVALVVTEPVELPEELAAVPDDDPEDLAALDAVWEEAQVTFGPDPNAGCPVSRDILARMDAPRAQSPAQ
ncbi:nitrate reductase molybdenum cofactor assembly chaperone (plasmid) [Paracoccus kondratievae]|uniref:Nitrate reductase molybdenum cofactor assembly chaperone n=1 Tax=Paracoccus kondratievae TaxID=135740 RepID=A0AAD3NZ59_9RHOB|nr:MULTISPECIES: nitrate reductase molybdenum cofactor assembly chaperone [Paracoccus]QFQ89651.1 nitrate reductase molybdenum cofactor assembly chaperone [Paracoccus kondratievae]GLK64617.1 nitrate reductase molybdenum cofactor assembly chaperone [Paracoccus kondratievae]